MRERPIHSFAAKWVSGSKLSGKPTSLSLLLFVTDTQLLFGAAPPRNWWKAYWPQWEREKNTLHKTWDAREHICGGGGGGNWGRENSKFSSPAIPPTFPVWKEEESKRKKWHLEKVSTSPLWEKNSSLFGNVFYMLPKQTNMDLNIEIVFWRKLTLFLVGEFRTTTLLPRQIFAVTMSVSKKKRFIAAPIFFWGEEENPPRKV